MKEEERWKRAARQKAR